jgi:hypothetical protein
MTPTSTTSRKESESGFKQDYLDHRKTYKDPQIIPIEYDEIVAENKNCGKINCYFCDLMNRPDRGDISNRKNGWTANELATLEKEYTYADTEHLSTLLNRTVRAIWRKANEVGLKKVRTTYKKIA